MLFMTFLPSFYFSTGFTNRREFYLDKVKPFFLSLKTLICRFCQGIFTYNLRLRYQQGENSLKQTYITDLTCPIY